MFSKEEYTGRIGKLRALMQSKGVDTFIIFDLISLFYYTGSAQNGVFVVSEDAATYFVRRNMERAKLECSMDILQPMRSFRDVASVLDSNDQAPAKVGYAGELVSASLLNLFRKYFAETVEYVDMNSEFNFMRAVKSNMEVSYIQEAGKRQAEVFAAVPGMIREGMSEWDLGSAMRSEMMRKGEPGFSRFASSNITMGIGNISFGESGNYPTTFDGPGGVVGNNPAMPVVGSPNRFLKADDPIYIDFLYSHQGYFVDCTRMFFLNEPTPEVRNVFEKCLQIQDAVVSRMVPGAIPEEIFHEVMGIAQELNCTDHLMGFGSNQVGFFGHGVGLVVNDMPVIAPKFKAPLEPGMVIAVEPKIGIEGVGMVGIENTWLITEDQPEKLTVAPDTITVLA